MGILFTVTGGGKNIELTAHSVVESLLEISTDKYASAKENEIDCRFYVKCEINQSSVSAIEALAELAEWGKQCRVSQKCYREMKVVQTYGEKFYREVIFPDARLVRFEEVFMTENGKFMEISVMMEQKKSRQDAVKVTFS